MSRRLGTDSLVPVATTRVNVLLDSSGSMQSRKDTTIEALKEFISGLKKEAKDKNLNIILTIKTFASDIYNKLIITTLVDKKVVGDISPSLVDKYSPNGGTPLYDALGEHINSVGKQDGVIDMFVIQTDGQENASKKYEKEDIKKLIDDKQNKEKWQFIFLGVDFDAMGESQNINVSAGNTFTFAGAQSVPAYSMMASAIGNYTMYRSANLATSNTDTFVKDYLTKAIDMQSTNTPPGKQQKTMAKKLIDFKLKGKI